MSKTYTGPVRELLPHQVFVFGSNTQGRHGKGAALWARQHAGAIYGQPGGLQGQSWAMVTKDLTKDTHPSLPMQRIVQAIARLYTYARAHPEKEFLIAYSGTGTNLNGYTPQQMAAMFACTPITGEIPENIVFEETFRTLIDRQH